MIGNKFLLKENNVKISEEILEKISDNESQGKTVLLVTVD